MHRSMRRRANGTAVTLLVVCGVAGAVGVGVGVGVGVAVGAHPGSSGHRVAQPPRETGASRPLSVVGFDPPPGTSGVAPDQPVVVDLDGPLAQGSPEPVLSPAVPGSWVESGGGTLTFDPLGPLAPGATETVTVPGGTAGVLGRDGGRLEDAVTSRFTVAPMSTLRVQQILAELGYLPLTWTPADPAGVPGPAEALSQPGEFTWRWTSLPASLTSQWTPGSADVITRGAIMSFQSQHGLEADGVAGPLLWPLLLDAVAMGQQNPYGHWDWVDVSTGSPESVTIFRDGTAVFSTPANTGVPAAPTAAGTFPVYLRYRTTTMSGTNPDGSHYEDPGIPWVSYFNGGDALHGFVRPGYGYPQSDGCVEMAPGAAATVWPLTPVGTLVTVE